MSKDTESATPSLPSAHLIERQFNSHLDESSVQMQGIAIRGQTEKFEQFRSHILELLVGAEPFSYILESLVRGIEKLNPKTLCSILLLDSDGLHLCTGAAPSLPGFYNEAIDGIKIGMGVGSCGTAAFTGESIIVDDIATHPYWTSYKELAARAGFGSCWSQPILSSSGQVLGTFAVYHREVHVPTEFDRFIIEQSVCLACIAIERMAAAEKIQHLAFYDPLTLLPNRRLLLDRLQQALASSSRSGRGGALLIIDLDNFKTLNSTLGHDMGDLLLQQVAQRLTSCLRKNETVARLGGDEFVVILEGLSEDALESATQTEIVVEKILAILGQPYLIASHSHLSTPSIGAALFSDCGQDIDSLFKQADIAMYQAKKDGRNTLRFFNPDMQIAITNLVALEGDLRRAVAEEDQFLLYYQPQVESSGHMIGAEVLLRWQHPVRGMVSPSEFIPLAEESGLILPLGHWVLVTACRQLAAWAVRPDAAHLTIEVNISAKQFSLPTFVEEVLSLINHFKIDPTKLKLEITESMLLNNVDDIIAKMIELKARGINFSMDDFGTGYSSLQYLKRLPLNQLKIDQSFVRDVIADGSDRAIVSTIIVMAQSLGLGVIAEGVETEEQQQLLLEKGCAYYQGYLFGKPMPIEQFEMLLDES